MTTLVGVAIHRKGPMSLVVRSRMCRHEEGLLLFLTRADIHPYVIWKLESSPNLLRAVRPHLHWEFLTCRSADGIATVMGSETAKIYQSYFGLLFPFIHDQTDPWLGSLVGHTKRCQHKGREGEPDSGAVALDCPLQLQLWLGQPQQNPSYSVAFACQETKEARLKKKVQQNVKRPFLSTGHLSSVLSVSALCKYIHGMWRRAWAQPFGLCDANIKRAANWRERFSFEGLSFQSSNSMMHRALGAATATSFPVKQSSDFHCSHSILQKESHPLHAAPRVLPHGLAHQNAHSQLHFSPPSFLPFSAPSWEKWK